MPWKIEVRNDEHCVVKEGDGSSEGCHATREAAVDHMKALYASEKKSIDSADETLAKGLLNDLRTVLRKTLKGEAENNDPKPPMFFWKDGEVYRWIARYSNKWRDDDNPPEIISDASHRKFVALVKSGLVKPPELWLWHEPHWKFGEATWVTYDDAGFALAGGFVYPEFNTLAEQLSVAKGLGVSHGMPRWSVRYDPEDPTVIVEHVTEEISPLPLWAAANKMTSFIILQTKENDDMAISIEEKERLMQRENVSPELLEKLELMNAKEADLANTERESKDVSETAETAAEAEADEVVTAEAAPEAETKAEETAEIAETKEAPAPVTNPNEELVKALGQTMQAVITLSQRVEEISNAVKSLSESEEKRVAQKAANTPLASLAQLMATSVVGNENTRVDGRTSLAKEGPEETKPAPTRVTGIPMIDGWLQPVERQ